jgi:4-hydroxy-L-threonine phosphate dehydrogenase PdxA
MKNKILILSADPNSINSELIYKSWKKINKTLKKKIFIISNYKLLKEQYKKLNYSIKIRKINNISEHINTTDLKVINVNLKFKNSFKVKKKDAADFIDETLTLGHKLALDKSIMGIINCPINKNLFKKKIGATEFFSSKCGLKKNTEVMLIRNDELSVSPITTHINIKNVSKNINTEMIVAKIKLINSWYKKYLNIKPKIGLLGLNPHNDELRKDSEEKKIIIPAKLKLKKKGINLDGPLVSDTVFINEYKKYDVIVGMYHDQVLAPFKTLYKFDAINITLGLNYLRVSPDHGTAINLIGKNKASPKSLLNCIDFVNKFKT